MFNVNDVRKDFPILTKQVHDKPLVYLDNAATSQKPRPVVEAMTNYYYQHNANVHRGVHQLSDESTDEYEKARLKIASFFGAHPTELILVRNTTEALNGIAYGWADHQLKAGDVIWTSLMEHHSNLVVWQEVCRRTGAHLEYIPLVNNEQLDGDWIKQNLSEQVKMIAVSHVSNVLGTVNPVAWLARQAHSVGARLVVDAAQSAPHLPLNFHKLGADFMVFSGHKMFGPMGIGGLLVRRSILESEEMRPWLFGGGMIAEVHTSHTVYQPELEERFVAGTPDVASAVGLAAACSYLSDLSMTAVQGHDQKLVEYALARLAELREVQLIGPQFAIETSDTEWSQGGEPLRVGSVAFIYHGVHAHDVAQVLDGEGIAVRSGHHCTMPLHEQCGWAATTRASFQVYNKIEEIDSLIEGLLRVKRVILS
jgi:cysteine desulfurase / selenocysteine lyase